MCFIVHARDQINRDRALARDAREVEGRVGIESELVTNCATHVKRGDYIWT